MNDPQATQFGQAALRSGLVSETELAECWERIPREKQTPDAIDRRLARSVIERGLLTKWQAQNLLGGLRPQGLWFDKYVLLDVLGQGGMGRVYLARDSRLGRQVALKVLSRERMTNARAVARFRREARVGAQLQHDNLVRVYDEGEVGGTCYLVMEFIDGKSVGQLLARRGPLPAPIAARIVRQVADGLEHAARKRLVHRDVNPMNILVDQGGTVKLTDLGLAIDLEDPGTAVTRDGATVGTFDYISPEQARHSHNIDIRSDIYSLGCTLYHMLAGRVPFPQVSLPEKLYAHQSLAATPIEVLVPDLPIGLPAVLRQMMAKRPVERFANPEEVSQALQRFEGPPVTLAEIEAAPEVPIWVDPSASTEPGSSPTTGSGGSVQDSANSSSKATGAEILPPIDTGAFPTHSLRTSPEKRPPHPGFPLRRTVTVLSLGGIVLLLSLAFWTLRGGDRASKASPAELRYPSAPVEVAPKARSPFVVHWLRDDTEQALPTLQDAVRLALGKDAEVVLDDEQVISISTASPLVISGGAVTLKAAKGARPVLDLDLTGSTSGIIVRFDGSLKLVGLTLRCDRTRSATPTALIRSAGDLNLEGCTLTTGGSVRTASGVRVESKNCSIRSCEFRGFGQAVDISSFGGTRMTIRDSLFLHNPTSAAEPCWAVQVRVIVTGRDRGTRRLSIDGSSALGVGLLLLTGPNPATPLEVDVHRCLVVAPSLLGWSGSTAVGQGLVWKGSEDRYAISGPSWVAASEGVASPANLQQWNELMGEEPGTATIETLTLPNDTETRAAGELPAGPDGFGAKLSTHDGPQAQGSPESR